MTQQEKQVNYMGPFITMVFLFFIVGFLTTANTQFQGPLKETFLAEVGGLKNTFATLITFSWFLAYPVCGRVGSSWISKYGYKGTLMRGLLVMVAGLGLFFASSYFASQYIFIILKMFTYHDILSTTASLSVRLPFRILSIFFRSFMNFVYHLFIF